MSILLEALRKSEKQRRLGQTPSIHSPSDETKNSGVAGPAWIPAVLIAVSALAMAWFGWEQYRAPATVAEEAPSSPASGQSPALERVTAESGDSAAAEPVNRAPGEGSGADATTIRKPGLVAAPRRPERTPVESFQADARASEAETATNPDQATSPAAAPQAQRRNSRVNQDFQQYAAEPGAPPDAGVSTPAAMPATTATAGMPQADEPGEQPAATPHQPEPITYWELPQGVRDSMPEMRITVLVYAEQPENRFLLIGGQRLVEGEEYESGVQLEEIRRGGAVFVYRNYRFLVKG